MKIITALVLASAFMFTGCASVNMSSQADSTKAKAFSAPTAGKAGLYVYRSSFGGAALKKDIYVDDKCLGESANNVFFYTEVEGGKMHKIGTESEFSPNTLEMMFETGKNYFIRQFIKLGVFVGGAGLELIPEDEGKAEVIKLEMAAPGKCG